MTDPPLRTRPVETSTCVGEVRDQGAQVTRWGPRDAEPVLYLSRTAHDEPGRSVRGGVPVCWPWFGPGRGGTLEPMHGFVRTAPWQLVEESAREDTATFVHRVTSETASSPHWPYRYAVQLRSTLGRELEIALTTTNLSEEPFDYEEALHAYLVVGDVRQVRIDGLEGKSFFDKVSGTEREQGGPLTFTGETDAVFRTSDPVTLHDPVLGRRLVVTTEGASNLVVWNPWEAKAADIADLPDDDWTRFVCIEGANALENAVPLEPGESHTTTYRLAVEAP